MALPVKFGELIKKSQIEQDSIRILENGKLQKVEVDLKKNLWRIWWQLDEVLPPYSLMSLRQLLLDACPALDKVIFEVKFVSADLTLLDVVNKHWDWVKIAIENKFSSLNGWIKAIKPRMENDELIVEVPGKMGVELLSRRGFPNQLQELIYSLFELECTIRLKDVSAADKVNENEYLDRYLIEIAKVADKETANRTAKNNTSSPSPILMGRKIKEDPWSLKDIRKKNLQLL